MHCLRRSLSDTGPWPASYRVTTLFERVLFALKVEASHDRPPLDDVDGFGKTPGLSVVSNSKGCVMSLTFDDKIIRFAEAAHAAFADIPLMGGDVVRRASDGKLFVVDVNASGWVSHFSSPLELRAKADFETSKKTIAVRRADKGGADSLPMLFVNVRADLILRIRHVSDDDLKRRIHNAHVIGKRGCLPSQIPEWFELDDADCVDLLNVLERAG